MKGFKPLSNAPVAEKEGLTSQYWDDNKILDKSIENREGKKPLCF